MRPAAPRPFPDGSRRPYALSSDEVEEHKQGCLSRVFDGEHDGEDHSLALLMHIVAVSGRAWNDSDEAEFWTFSNYKECCAYALEKLADFEVSHVQSV